MDPATAFGVAAGVVQLASFAATVVKVSSEIYQSSSHLSKDNEKLDEIAKQIRELSENLQRRVPSNIDATSDANIKTVAAAASTCQSRAQDLIDALDKLRARGREKRKLFVLVSATPRSLLKKSRMKQLAEALQDSKSALDTAMLTGLIQGADVQNDMQRKTLEDMSLLSMSTLSEFNEVKDLLRGIQSSIADFKREVREQHEQTRALVERPRREDEEAQANEKIVSDIIERLAFPEINQREETVQEAFPSTFSWLLDLQRDESYTLASRERKIGLSFANWLRDGQELFWISGIPGAGKSTLMKWLVDDQQRHTLEKVICRSNDSSRATPTILSYFFWKHGSSGQRSVAGCLRSLLRQLLATHPYLVKALDTSPLNQVTAWTRKRLLDSLHAVLSGVREEHSPLCIFIDGLDECADEEQIDLVSLVKNFSKLGKVKVCASSRAENIFLEALRSCPRLEIHELTWRDMLQFAGGELLKHQNSLFEPAAFQDFCDKAATHIAQRAEGIFLWARVVVTMVTDELQNGAELHSLHQMIESTTKGLDGLFKEILLRHGTGKFQSALIFSYVAQCDFLYKWLRPTYPVYKRPPTCNNLWTVFLMLIEPQQDQELKEAFAACLDPRPANMYMPSFLRRARVTPTPVLKFQRSISRLENRIRSSCGGLIEPPQSNFEHCSSLVESVEAMKSWGLRWLHRSAAEYMKTSDVFDNFLASDPQIKPSVEASIRCISIRQLQYARYTADCLEPSGRDWVEPVMNSVFWSLGIIKRSETNADSHAMAQASLELHNVWQTAHLLSRQYFPHNTITNHASADEPIGLVPIQLRSRPKLDFSTWEFSNLEFWNLEYSIDLVNCIFRASTKSILRSVLQAALPSDRPALASWILASLVYGIREYRFDERIPVREVANICFEFGTEPTYAFDPAYSDSKPTFLLHSRSGQPSDRSQYEISLDASLLQPVSRSSKSAHERIDLWQTLLLNAVFEGSDRKGYKHLQRLLTRPSKSKILDVVDAFLANGASREVRMLVQVAIGACFIDLSLSVAACLSWLVEDDSGPEETSIEGLCQRYGFSESDFEWSVQSVSLRCPHCQVSKAKDSPSPMDAIEMGQYLRLVFRDYSANSKIPKEEDSGSGDYALFLLRQKLENFGRHFQVETCYCAFSREVNRSPPLRSEFDSRCNFSNGGSFHHLRDHLSDRVSPCSTWATPVPEDFKLPLRLRKTRPKSFQELHSACRKSSGYPWKMPELRKAYTPKSFHFKVERFDHVWPDTLMWRPRTERYEEILKRRDNAMGLRDNANGFTNPIYDWLEIPDIWLKELSEVNARDGKALIM